MTKQTTVVAVDSQFADIAARNVGFTRDGTLKHTDDAMLMVSALSVCARLRAGWLFLVASDGDFAPLVWALRDFGVRTELFASADALAPELRRAAHRVTFLDTWLHAATARTNKKTPVPLQLIRTTERVTAPGSESLQTVN